eukprot:403346599
MSKNLQLKRKSHNHNAENLLRVTGASVSLKVNQLIFIGLKPTQNKKYPNYSFVSSPRRKKKTTIGLNHNQSSEQTFPNQEEIIAIDRGLSDLKIPYFPDFGVPVFFEGHEGALKDNWRRLYEQLIRNPQHSNLIQYIKEKNFQKEIKCKELELKKEKEANSLLETIKSNGNPLRRKISMYRGSKEHNKLMDIAINNIYGQNSNGLGDSFMKVNENSLQNQKNQHHQHRPSTLNIYATIMTNIQQSNDQQLNPLMQKKFQQIGSKYQNIKNEVGKITLQQDKFSGFLDQLRKESPQKSPTNISVMNQTVQIEKSSLPQIQDNNVNKQFLLRLNHSPDQLNTLSQLRKSTNIVNSKPLNQQQKQISHSLRNSPRFIQTQTRASYDLDKIERKIMLLEKHQEIFQKKIDSNQEYQGLRKELYNKLEVQKIKGNREGKKQKRIGKNEKLFQSFQRHSIDTTHQTFDMLDFMIKKKTSKQKQQKQASSHNNRYVSIQNVEDPLTLQSLDFNSINIPSLSQQLKEESIEMPQNSQLQKRVILQEGQSKKISDKLSCENISDVQTQIQTPMDIIPKIKRNKIKTRQFAKSSQASPRIQNTWKLYHQKFKITDANYQVSNISQQQ